MTWDLEWHPAALRGFYALPKPAAERLDKAIIEFARTSHGPVMRHPHQRGRLKLLVPGAVAYLFANDASGHLLVGYVFEGR